MRLTNNRRVILAVLVLALSGCNPSVSPDYHKLSLGTVTGTVKLEGKPLPNHHIIFQSEKGTFSYGKTNSRGEYSLMFNSQKPGVTSGTKTVRIRKRRFSESDLFPSNETTSDEPEVSGDLASAQGEDVDNSNTDGLPDVYHLKSHLKVDVIDSNQVINFDLKQDGSTTGPE